jgi:hypothetical protein
MAQENKDILVFIVRRDTECSECGEELWRGSFLFLEKDKALCLSCADLDHLEYLSSGDAALTRRSIKYSKIHARVLKWSKTRNRYERQGILVEPEAIEKAEIDSRMFRRAALSSYIMGIMCYTTCECPSL